MKDGETYGEAELVEDRAESFHASFHVAFAKVPEASFLGLLEPDGSGFLEGRGGVVADSSVGGCHVLDEVGGSDEPADAPAGAVE